MSGFQIATDHLTVRFGATVALDAVTSTFAADRIHGLLGRNGAGKTTLLSALAGRQPATSGSVHADGKISFEDPYLHERICLIRESGDFYPDISVAETLDFVERGRPTFDPDFAGHLLASFAIERKNKIRTLSRGKRSAFAAVVGLAVRAPVTMFDEVHLGMDAPTRERFYELLLAEFAEQPRTIIISSHLISEIENLLETVTILHDGHLLLQSESDDLRDRGFTVTGPAAAVDDFARGLTVVGARDLGPTRQITVFGDVDADGLASARARGLDIGGVGLQDLFIHLTEEPS